jgi:anti-sigma regulatory factor (Ser/Thr protein kinase)
MSAPAPARVLLHAVFDAGRVAHLRHLIARLARQSGLEAGRTDDLVVAVNEVMTNAVRHGGGTGEVRLVVDHDLVCEVNDTGAGFDAAAHTGRTVPPPPRVGGGGLGIWMARQVADALSIASGPAGTRARIRFALPRA